MAKVYCKKCRIPVHEDFYKDDSMACGHSDRYRDPKEFNDSCYHVSTWEKQNPNKPITHNMVYGYI